MANATIRYKPASVDVGDERKSVAGASVVIDYADLGSVSHDIIPPEGDSPDCWLGSAYTSISGLDEAAWIAMVDALEVAAVGGAAGHSGSIEVEMQE